MAAPMSSSGAKLFKVAFDLELERPGWPPVAVERLWGEKTNVKLEVRVANIPFFVRGVSFGDLIQVQPDHERRELVFERLRAESGHSTIRIVIMKAEARQEIESALSRAGCSMENAVQFENLIAVDIPPETPYQALLQWLVARREDGDIEVQEAAISTGHRA